MALPVIPYIIRTASGDDSPAAAEVVKAVFKEYGFSWDPDDYCADLLDIQTWYLDRGHRFWVAELTEPVGDLPSCALVGTTALELFERFPVEVGGLVEADGLVRIAGTDCSLERLYVHPEARRMRLGTRLLAAVVEEALRLGRTRMEIWSDKKLTKAHAMYEKFGAVRVGDRICDDPDDSHEWGMALDLTPELVEKLKS